MPFRLKAQQSAANLMTSMLTSFRKKQGKLTEWNHIAGLKKISTHADDRFSEVLYLVNCALYMSNIPHAGRKAIIECLRQEFDDQH